MNYYLGEIIAFAGYYVPENFQLCDGSSLSVADYNALYSVIGNTYGGNATNFNVPKLSGLVIVGTGNSKAGTAYALGANGGANAVTLQDANMPVHTHAFNATTNNATTGNPANALLAASNGTGYPANSSQPFAYSQAPASNPPVSGILNADSVSMVGGSQSHNNQQPYITVNYMICINGLYPTPS